MTKFYFHEGRRLVAILSATPLPAYITQHSALPPAEEWLRVLPTDQNIPLYRAQGELIDQGAEPLIVFRATEQPVETMHWRGGLVSLTATLRRAVKKYEISVLSA